jgi:hypothetical protein
MPSPVITRVLLQERQDLLRGLHDEATNDPETVPALS